jgi:hypothetical protein
MARMDERTPEAVGRTALASVRPARPKKAAAEIQNALTKKFAVLD